MGSHLGDLFCSEQTGVNKLSFSYATTVVKMHSLQLQRKVAITGIVNISSLVPCATQALQQQMSKAAGLAADRSAALGSLDNAKAELVASQAAAAGLRVELAGSQAEAARLRYSLAHSASVDH